MRLATVLQALTSGTRITSVQPITQGDAMAVSTNLNPGVRTAPDTLGAGESLPPPRNGSGKINSRKCEHCNSAGTATQGIGGA